jgi:hypothetical protein
MSNFPDLTELTAQMCTRYSSIADVVTNTILGNKFKWIDRELKLAPDGLQYTLPTLEAFFEATVKKANNQDEMETYNRAFIEMFQLAEA